MRNLLVFSTCTILILLGLLHLFWAAGGKLGRAAAVPSTDGFPTFKPSDRSQSPWLLLCSQQHSSLRWPAMSLLCLGRAH